MTAVAHVEIELDTTPPVVKVEGESVVTPPDDLVFTVTSSEDIGTVTILFTDSFGSVNEVGYEQVDARTLVVRIPTAAMTQGDGSLRVMVSDEVANVATVSRIVVVNRPRPFDVVVTLDRGFGFEVGVYHPYEVTVTLSKEDPSG